MQVQNYSHVHSLRGHRQALSSTDDYRAALNREFPPEFARKISVLGGKQATKDSGNEVPYIIP